MNTIKFCLSLIFLFVIASLSATEVPVEVNVLNYVSAKSSLHFDGVIKRSGGINKWTHGRTLTPLDQQRITRMNRDTLYSSAVIDISKGASFSIPDSGSRYLSATVVNENHFINKIFHTPGVHTLNIDEFDTPYVLLTIRILVNESGPVDIKKAHALQDKLIIESASANVYTHPNYEPESLKATTKTLLELAAKMPDANKTYGEKEQVDKVRHLLGTAYGWGGLPENEASYINVQPNLPIGTYSLTVKDVPVDGFWSISMYNKDGYFEKNEYSAYSINNLTANTNKDGSYTIHFGSNSRQANFLPITEGWNYVVRMYRPREAIIDKTWSFPDLVKLD